MTAPRGGKDAIRFQPAQKQPPEVSEPELRAIEQRAWFPPDFQDFETAMEVTAQAGRR